MGVGMERNVSAFRSALVAERERNSRQIAAFRFGGLLVVVGLQMMFVGLWDDWSGAPMGPLLGYTAAAALAWRLRKRFDSWSAWTGYTVAAVDMPMVWWLVTASAKATVDGPAEGLSAAVLMILPLANAGFLVMASLTLDATQTVVAAAVAIGLQGYAIAQRGYDFTFLSMVTAFTVLIAVVCLYWRDQSVRLVRKTSTEQARRERLGRYFSPQVAQLLEAGGEEGWGSRREVTVLFADLRAFTRMAEGLDPREVVVLLNRFHTAMVDVVFAFGGTLDKYLGDGLMAYFGAPVRQEDQALRAVRCALGMQAALADLNRRRGDTAMRMGIGVHTGPAVVGDIGAESRREFTVIGDAVNVASRLEQLTKEHDAPVLVSGSTARAVGDCLPMRHLGSVMLRGRSEAVELYAPVIAEGGGDARPSLAAAGTA